MRMALSDGIARGVRVYSRALAYLITPGRMYDETIRAEPGWGYRRYYLPLVFLMVGVTTVFSWYGISVHGIEGSVCGRTPLWLTAIAYGILVPFGTCVSAVIVNTAVFCAGGRTRGGLGQTAKALFYGATPILVFGWVPVIGSVAPLYSMILTVLGLRSVHNLTWRRMVLAGLAAILICLVLGVATYLIGACAGVLAVLVFLGLVLGLLALCFQ
jgi:hypothetical protein